MILFLHGFLGQKEDWDPLLTHLPSSLPICTLNLPLTATDIALAVHTQVPSARCIIGYSAGGRIALELKHRFPTNYNRVIAISAHPGLKTEEERKARLITDEKWISLLKHAPFDQFLEKWYSQELFQTLKAHPHFPDLLLRRKNQNPHDLAHFLEHFSLAIQTPPNITPNTIWIHGKEDLKYAALYRTLSGKIFSIDNAGHAPHIENSKACAEVILGAINDHY